MSGFYGNTNNPSSFESREEIQQFCQTMTGDCVFNVNMTTNKYNAIKQAQNTRFLFAVLQYEFTNTLDTIYAGNNAFTLIEQRTDTPTPANTIDFTIPAGIYNIVTLLAQLQTSLNATTSMGAGGSYAFTLSGTLPNQFVRLTITPPAGQTWQFTIPTFSSLTIPQQAMMRILGFQLQSGAVSSTNLTATSLYNIFAVNDSIYLCCNALRYPSIMYNSNYNNQSQGRLYQILLPIPLFVDSMAFEYKIMEILQYVETTAWPFGKNTQFSLVDENGILMSSQQGVTLTFSIQVRLFTSDELTQ